MLKFIKADRCDVCDNNFWGLQDESTGVRIAAMVSGAVRVFASQEGLRKEAHNGL